MSRAGEAVLRTIVGRRRSSPGAQGCKQDADRGQDWASYIRWQYDSSARLFSKYPGWNVEGKRVLEIGCGTGGRACYLAAAGAREVVGIDINREEIAIAQRACCDLFPELCGRVTFLASGENDLLDIGEFDVVVLIDAMEHVVSPPAMMRLAASYTALGGAFYFSNIGWYHALGSHTGLMPFANLFFSDETILNVIRWKVSQKSYMPTRFDSEPPVKRWEGIYNLRDRPGEYLNKLTVREVKQLVRYSPFSEARLDIVGFGQKHPAFRLLDPLRHVPILQEIYHSYLVVRCVR